MPCSSRDPDDRLSEGIDQTFELALRKAARGERMDDALVVYAARLRATDIRRRFARGGEPRRDAMHPASYTDGRTEILRLDGIDEILGLYGSDPVFMPQHAPALIGRDAVRAGYQRVFEAIQLNIRFEIHEVERAGEWAWARTTSAGRTRILAAGTEVAEGNNELFVFRREHGAWMIHRHVFSTNRPRG